VALDRADAHEQQLTDLVIAPSLSDEPGDSAFGRGQRPGGATGRGPLELRHDSRLPHHGADRAEPLPRVDERVGGLDPLAAAQQRAAAQEDGAGGVRPVPEPVERGHGSL
jgi:hypothetical protein